MRAVPDPIFKFPGPPKVRPKPLGNPTLARYTVVGVRLVGDAKLEAGRKVARKVRRR